MFFDINLQTAKNVLDRVFNLGDATLPPNSSLSIINSEFGITWGVPKDYWLFSGPIISQIASDMEEGLPYTPKFEAHFRDERQKTNAKHVRHNNSFQIPQMSV